MKFGRADNLDGKSYELPRDHSDTLEVLSLNTHGLNKISIGCAKWNRQDLKGFYPRGTKDELVYYASQFNSIELNATFYRIFPNEQSVKWAKKTPGDFRFFPKVPQSISHFQRLRDCDDLVNQFCDSIAGFEEKLGMPFLQMPDNFSPKNYDSLVQFISAWPKGVPLALELRHTDWHNEDSVSTQLYSLLKRQGISNIITDTVGRRDLLHMRLTSPSVFIRYVGANHPSDYVRLKDWVDRIKTWQSQGLRDLYFFIHQNIEKESPLLSQYFIQHLNKSLGLEIRGSNILL